MNSLPRSPLAFLCLTVLAFVGASGCDSNEPPVPQDRPAPVPQDRLDVRTFEVDFDLATADFEGSVASAAFDAPELTRETVDYGLVMAYVWTENVYGEEAWRALPYTYGVEFPEDPDIDEEASVDYTVTLGYAYKTNFFEIFYEISDYDDFVWDQIEDQGARTIRVIVFSRDAVQNSRGLDYQDYGAVEERFELNP